MSRSPTPRTCGAWASSPTCCTSGSRGARSTLLGAGAEPPLLPPGTGQSPSRVSPMQGEFGHPLLIRPPPLPQPQRPLPLLGRQRHRDAEQRPGCQLVLRRGGLRGHLRRGQGLCLKPHHQRERVRCWGRPWWPQGGHLPSACSRRCPAHALRVQPPVLGPAMSPKPCPGCWLSPSRAPCPSRVTNHNLDALDRSRSLHVPPVPGLMARAHMGGSWMAQEGVRWGKGALGDPG